MKSLGIVLILASGVLWGLSERRKLRNRTTSLIQLQRFLVALKSRIAYTSAPLEEILRTENNRIAKKVIEECDAGADVKNAWEQAAFHLFYKDTDVAFMQEFMEDFGKSDVLGQSGTISIYIERISPLISEAQKEAESKGRVKVAASTFFAVTVALILL